ncbi:MAG: exo-alpha-sialidase [Bacteroidetes bacterium]|nr:exo-alpha-sialidase [Bacteroidota bacterium]
MRYPLFILPLMTFSFFCCQQIPGIEPPLAASLHTSVASTSDSTRSEKAVSDRKLVIRSLDGGQTWEDVSTGIPKDVLAGHIMAQENEVLLAGDGLYRLSNNDAALKWEKDFFWKDEITGIFPGKKGPYFCKLGAGFYREIPQTGVWVAMHETLPDPFVRAVLETSNGVLLAGCNSGIYKSTDDGKHWKRVFEGEMILRFAEADGILLGGGQRGLLRSTDSGEHWDRVLSEEAAIRKIDRSNNRLLALSNDIRPWQDALADKNEVINTLRFSDDGGKTWQGMNDAFRSLRFIYRPHADISPSWIINDIQQAGKYLFCSLDAGIFRSSDQGKSWQLVYEADVPDWIAQLTVCDGVIYAVLSAGC